MADAAGDIRDPSYLGAADLDEILAAVEMPRAGVRQWLAGLQQFCDAHGGTRYYGRLQTLLDACQERLDESDGPKHGPPDYPPHGRSPER